MTNQRSQSRETLREKAFTDFVNMGPRRSINSLWESYKEEAAEHGPKTVPTLNRPTLYEWAKEDNWVERADQTDKKVIESERRNYEKIRTDRMDDLADLSIHAMEAVRNVLTRSEELGQLRDKVTPAHMLRASELVLDRFGMTAKNATKQTENDDEGILSEDEVSSLEEFYQELVNNR